MGVGVRVEKLTPLSWVTYWSNVVLNGVTYYKLHFPLWKHYEMFSLIKMVLAVQHKLLFKFPCFMQIFKRMNTVDI